MQTLTKWPKTFPPLTPEQKRISDDFMKHWHEVLPRKFGIIEKFNQGYAVKHAPAGFTRTLEIGAGLGEHLRFENLTPEQEANYYALEIRENMSREIARQFPKINTITGAIKTPTSEAIARIPPRVPATESTRSRTSAVSRRFRYSATTGTKACEKAPSAKRRRKRFGI